MLHVSRPSLFCSCLNQERSGPQELVFVTLAVEQISLRIIVFAYLMEVLLLNKFNYDCRELCYIVAISWQSGVLQEEPVIHVTTAAQG